MAKAKEGLPKLSLCINTHNEGADLLQTILSVRANYSGPFEAVVVDDAGTDGSAAALLEYRPPGVYIYSDDVLDNCSRWFSKSEECEDGHGHQKRPCSECRQRNEPTARGYHEITSTMVENAITTDDLKRLMTVGWITPYDPAGKSEKQIKDDLIDFHEFWIGEDDWHNTNLLGYTLVYLDDNAYVKVIRNKTRVGCGKAKAQAVAAATGDVILHMDGHCRVLRGPLDDLVQYCADHEAICVPGVAPLHVAMNMQPASDDPYKGGSTCYGGTIDMTVKGPSVGPAWKPRKATRALRPCTWYAIFAMSKKTLLERLGGWNEFPGCWGSQEIGLALRAWFADVPVYAFADIVCGHRYQDDKYYKAYQAELKAKGIKHYAVKARETAANGMYAVSGVFDQATVNAYWHPFWRERYGETRYAEACALLAGSLLVEQAADFTANRKRKSDEEFFQVFGRPTDVDAPAEAEPEVEILPMPVEPDGISPDDVTAILLHYKRPVNCQKAVDALLANGIKNVWVWCQEGIASPNGATRVFTDSQNAMTWARYAVAPLAPTPYVLFCDDDVELRPAGVQALLCGAKAHPGRNIGLIGVQFNAPFDSYRHRTFFHSAEIKEAVEVDMLWPKGQLMPRDMAQVVFGRADLWQAMREKVKGTSGDDFVGVIAQALEGLPPSMVVPSDGKAYDEHHAEGKEFALSKQGARYTAKRRTFALWRERGWKPLLMAQAERALTPSESIMDQVIDIQPAAVNWDVPDRFGNAIAEVVRLEAQISQHPAELRLAWEMVNKRKPQVFVEIGSAWGGTLYAYAQACAPGAEIIAIDTGTRAKCRPSLKRVLQALDAQGRKTTWLRADSHAPETVARLKALLAGRRIDLLHVDGDHSLAGVRADTENYLPLIADDGLALYHDVHTISRCEVRHHWPELATAYDGHMLYEGEFNHDTAKAQGVPWRVTGQHGGYGIGVVDFRAWRKPPLAIFTPFGPERPWAVDLWKQNMRTINLPAGSALIVLDNTGDDVMGARIGMALIEASKEYDCKVVLLTRDWPKRASGVNHLRERMAAIWQTTRPFLRAERVLSLESDVRVPANVLDRLSQAARKGAAVAAAALDRKKQGTALVVDPEGPTGRVKARGVHLGCTLLDGARLQQADIREAASWGGGQDMALCEAMGGKIVYDWSVKCDHLEGL